MKIVSIVGSSRKKGNCSQISEIICTEAKNNSHESKTLYIYDYNIKGCTACRACKEEKVELCIHNDDFIHIAKDMIDADCIILSSPVYMGHITGPLKTFFDRWYTFTDKKFNIRLINKKKFVTITTSGAPAHTYKEAEEFLNSWCEHFFKMKKGPSIVAGGLMNDGDLQKQPEIIEQAKEIGRNLFSE